MTVEEQRIRDRENTLRWKARHPEQARIQADDTKARQLAKRRNFLIALKNKPCADCGREFPSCVMEFHHVRGEKEFSVGNGVNNALSLKRINDEIAKCDLLCANCHRIRTYGVETVKKPMFRISTTAMISHLEKLQLQPGDIIVVKHPDTLHYLEGLGKVVNFVVPLVFAPAGIDKLSRADLLNLLEQIEQGQMQSLPAPPDAMSAPL